MKYAKEFLFMIILLFLINSAYAMDEINETSMTNTINSYENNIENPINNEIQYYNTQTDNTQTDNIKTNDIETDNTPDNNITKSENDNLKTDNINSKHITNTVLKTTTNGSHIIMNVSVYSDIIVNGGYVIFKLNGVTLKNASDEKIKIYVHNSSAVLNLSTDQYRKVYWGSEAVYSGSSTFNASRSTQNISINTRITPEIKVTTDKKEYNPGDTVKLNITLSSSQANIFSGIIIFKINGETLRNEAGTTYILKFFGNNTIMNYTIPLGLKANNLTITTVSEGSRYNKIQTNNTISLKPLNTYLNIKNFTVNSDNYCVINATITDAYGRMVVGKTFVDVFVNGNKLFVDNKTKVYTIYNGSLNIRLPMYKYPFGNYTIKLVTRDSNCYNSASSRVYNINIIQKYPTKVIIDTPAMVKNGSILSVRVYVTYKDNNILKTVNDGNVSVVINNQKYDAYVVNGKAIMSYNVPSQNKVYTINATYIGEGEHKDSSATKNITVTHNSISAAQSSILGEKDPQTTSISLTNGIPNLVYMTNYVWGDENATYTLTRSQIQEVLQQDSYSLYLNKHLSKYVAFKTSDEPYLYHVLKREKWNVIEKTLNKYFVEKNTMTIPETLTVSLKGKSYTYSEARDIQDTSYTCGPTATSVCTQTLKNYVNEDTLAVDFKTYKYRGTYASNIPPAMKKYNISAVYFYKNSFDTQLSKLAQGGCTLVFYGVNHYVSILDISPDKTKVLVSNSYGNYSLGGGKIPNGWVSVSLMKNRFSSDSFGGLVVTLDYTLSSATKTKVNYLYNNFGSNWIRQNINEELNT
ncbi:MAG: hypothetical protein E7Z86_00580 [Methanosphaera stadtmanae]|jgi:hypothetical protein|nr:hypothetical protein [Methanosphaera stadtmanae]